VVLILRLDANFLESSIAASQKLYQKLERARRGQVWAKSGQPQRGPLAFAAVSAVARGRPVAWRQDHCCFCAVRGEWRTCWRPSVFWWRFRSHDGPARVGFADRSSAMMLMMMSLFMLPQMLQFDFRSDLERLDVLKDAADSHGQALAQKTRQSS